METLSDGAILGIGNPLLDIIANVDEEYLTKWKLDPNNQILATEFQKGLEDDMIKNYPVKYIAGGSVQNTIRIVQWLLNFKPNITTFIGCVGNDKFGELMLKKSREDGTNCIYEVDKNEKTGYCCALVTNSGKNRSLCAYLGAANHLSYDFVLKNWPLIEKAQIIYISGFHITSCFRAILHIAKYIAQSDKKQFYFNLSAPFICKSFDEQVNQLMPYVDTVFGNDAEALSYAEVKKWGITKISEIAIKIANEGKFNVKKARTVILTQAHEPVFVACSNSKNVKAYNVKRLELSQLVDTNGAGDAFVAGYISQSIKNNSMDDRIAAAIYAAQEIIQQDGCSYPSYSPQI